ncbi:alpha/beta fold hydrolase [Kitasatospora sp. NPDC058965]|uniref:alpha/beta fold hydrolase n=1 Tax=Kitasatospora sp. NPDC058965 TaxID=3346682 RepID=UPI00368081FE
MSASFRSYDSYDGTRLAYRELGSGDPLVVLPGGPMADSAYLGDLGGLGGPGTGRRLIVLEPRGTGASETPADPATYRCDRQVADVEALRAHLGFERLDLLAHSAGAVVAVLYTAAHPERVGRMALIAPSTYAVGIKRNGATRRPAAHLRAAEPWFPAAIAAFERIEADEESEADWDAIAPFSYGRWDEAARAHYAAGDDWSNPQAEDAFHAEDAVDPAAVRAALGTLAAPVLVLAGALDWATTPAIAAEFAALFPQSELAVQEGAAHLPWLDDAQWFRGRVVEFLAG